MNYLLKASHSRKLAHQVKPCKGLPNHSCQLLIKQELGDPQSATPSKVKDRVSPDPGSSNRQSRSVLVGLSQELLAPHPNPPNLQALGQTLNGLTWSVQSQRM